MQYETKKFDSLKKAFRFWQKEHPNFMTNSILKLEAVEDLFIIELSEGSGLCEGTTLYGVTLIVYDSINKTFKSSREDDCGNGWFNSSFYEYSQALIHIDNIKKYLKDKKKVVC